jgi:chloramphenicol-sensitive protein RarD
VSNFKKGVLYAVFAYCLWGVLPLYWHLLVFTGPLHILGYRIIFSLFFTGIILLLLKNREWLRLISNPAARWFTIAAAVTVTANWGLYIWAVNNGHTIQASLGYYINPLISIVLGLIFMKERLNRLQWAAFALASIGVIMMTVFSGVFPWMSFLIALSFGIYGLLKKKTSSGSLEGLGAETLAAIPLGLLLIIFPFGEIHQLADFTPGQWILLVSCGAVTAIPLLAFSKGAKLLPLSAIGFLQFINPTILFFLSVFAFGEPFPPRNLWAFGFIWAAVILYCLSLRKRPAAK